MTRIFYVSDDDDSALAAGWYVGASEDDEWPEGPFPTQAMAADFAEEQSPMIAAE
jgi:hypothetical protein